MMKKHYADFKPPELLESQYVFESPWFSVREDTVIFDGDGPQLFRVVEMLPGVMIGPVTEQGEVYLVGQPRYAIGKFTWEVIGGGVDPGEDAIVAAKRELREESGLSASQWTSLGVAELGTAVLRSPVHFFLAQDLRLNEASPDPGEDVVIERFSLKEAVTMTNDGSICHLPSIVLILKLANLLDVL